MKADYRFRVDFESIKLGTATDLETVADLIDVLKQMNGGG